MALGGGSFVKQNKVLPGAYINFINVGKAASILSDRGIVALPVALDWGLDGEVFTVTADEFNEETLKHFGYPRSHDKMKGLRDLFQNVKVAHFYKLMEDGAAASNTLCTAKYKGVRGNDLSIVVEANVDDATKVDVSTVLEGKLVDKQTVLPETSHLVDNDFVTWKPASEITETAGLALTGGTNGSDLTGANYQAALDAFENETFNVLGCLATSSDITDLFIAYTKRLREDMGVKFQTLVYQNASADYEGVISLENSVKDTAYDPSALIYWTAGALSSIAINTSLTNKPYTGEFSVDTHYKQAELESALESGQLIFHKVGDEVRVLEDINTFVTVSDEKTADFSSNQTIRILDQIANDIAIIFSEKYMGNVPNDADGRISLWNDIVKHHQTLEGMRAIEAFDPEKVVVSAGETKKSVVITDEVTPISAMTQLYMTVIVK